MKITKSDVTKIRLTEMKDLDPIDILLEDYGDGQGQIIITCFGKTWSKFWGSMGEATIAEFFTSSSNQYLANKLDPMIKQTLVDIEAEKLKIKTKINDKGVATNSSLHELYEFVENLDDLQKWMNNNYKLTQLIYGERPDSCDKFEVMPNPDYEYLCKIIEAVKAGLRMAMTFQLLKPST